MATTKKTDKDAADAAKEAADKMAEEAQKGFESMSSLFMMPKLDMAAMGDFHRKNFDAANEAGKILFEGAKAVTAKQIEVGRNMMQDYSNFATGAGKAKSDTAAFSPEMVQELAQKNMSTAREISDIAFKANQKAFAVIQTRFSECMSDLQGEAS